MPCDATVQASLPTHGAARVNAARLWKRVRACTAAAERLRYACCSERAAALCRRCGGAASQPPLRRLAARRGARRRRWFRLRQVKSFVGRRCASCRQLTCRRCLHSRGFSFWHAPARRKRGPEGGNGGSGGDVVVCADAAVRCLAGVSTSCNAQPGGRGGPQQRAGRRGADCIVRVPVGTVVWQRLGACRQRLRGTRLLCTRAQWGLRCPWCFCSCRRADEWRRWGQQ